MGEWVTRDDATKPIDAVDPITLYSLYSLYGPLQPFTLHSSLSIAIIRLHSLCIDSPKKTISNIVYILSLYG